MIKLALVPFFLSTIITSAILSGSFFVFAGAQQDKNVTIDTSPFPVVLIHGYAQDASSWNKWFDLLGKDAIQFFPITFEADDMCGTSNDHAAELFTKIEEIKKITGHDKINIVGFSKGGLDARVYLDISNTNSVANLIMIGTPNAGSPLAIGSFICKPAVFDLVPGSVATRAERNPNTKYYTIAGDWLSKSEGNPIIQGNDDGWVPLSSVESKEYFTSLGHTEDYHLNLLDENEYNLAKQILLSNNINDKAIY
jgi:pimeloyl-ACP methyl ester carboxylesterase